MYKVLLVDDEALIREAISENTRWSDLGYELIGTCRNGKEAIERIKENPPDLLLTDICMPFVDGMELTKFVYEQYRDTKVVIISGYDEFEYAKKAVKYQVIEYILKPITALELSETLIKVREKLDGERIQIRNIQKIKGAYISNLPVMRGRFLNSLMQGNIHVNNLYDRFQEYNIKLDGSHFMTALILGDDLTPFLNQSEITKVELAHFAIYNIAEEIMKNYDAGVTFQDVEEKTVLVFSADAEIEKAAMRICEEIRTAIYKFLEIRCTIGLGQVVNSVEQLYHSFNEAKKAMEYKFLLGGNQVILAASLQEDIAQQGVDSAKWTSQIILAIKTSNAEDIRRNVQGFIDEIRNAYMTKNRSIFYVQNLILSIMNALDNSSMNETQIFGEVRELLNTIYDKEQLSDMAKDLITFCDDISESMKHQKDSYCKKQALIALDYIDNHYGDSNISLNSVCVFLSLSTSYFSTIFKAYTGETFIEALTKKRIEKAKNLIEHTGKKTYEIADEVGYSDPHYFSSSFKKMTGMTPTEYAKKMR